MPRAKVLITREIPKPGIDILKKTCKVKINEINSAEPYEFLSLEGKVLSLGDDVVIHVYTMVDTPNGELHRWTLTKTEVFTTLELALASIEGIEIRRGKAP